MKNKKIILIGIVIIIALLAIIYYKQPTFCHNQFVTLVNEELKLPKYKLCNSNSDCKIIGCGDCVNSEGVSKYNYLKIFCSEPQWECITPKGCSCESNTCIQKWD